MSEISFIVDQLKLAFEGEPWHGPALMEVLGGIDAKTASLRPISNAHCIWELVLHVAGWEQVVSRRLQGQPATLTDAQNFDLNFPLWLMAMLSILFAAESFSPRIPAGDQNEI